MLRVARSKVTIPAPPAQYVSRPRLLALLDRSAAAVSLVCAPPGFGKTLLLAEWARGAGGDTAWVSLDEGDNDERRLWWSVLAALSACPSAEQRSHRHDIEALHSEPDHELLAEIVSWLEELSEPIRLILDNVDLLVSSGALQGLKALIRSVPPGTHLVLSSRLDPPLGLPRIRLEGRLWELPADQLRCSLTEAGNLLETCSIGLKYQQFKALHALTGGWVAGLRLAALSLRDAPDPDAFLADFSGDDRSIADYLVGEVLSRLPEQTMRFLTAISTCDAIAPDLAAELSGREDAERLLDSLERETFLVARVDSGRQYSAQALARSYLRAELERRDPRRSHELHRTAARWWASRENPVEALAHATQADDPSLISDLLHRFGLTLMLTGSHYSLRRGLEAIGAQAIAADPWLAVLSAISHLEAGQLAEAADDLRHADHSAGQDGTADLVVLRAAAEVLQAHTAGLAIPQQRAPEIATPPAAEPGLEALACLIKASAHILWTEDRSAARSELEIALRLASRHDFDYLAMQCRTMLGAVAAVDGDYQSMSAAGNDAVEFAAAHGWQNSLWSSTAYSMVTNAALMRAEPADARRYASQGLSYGGTALSPAVRFALKVMHGAAVFDCGRQAEGLAEMQRARVDFGAASVTAAQAAGTALLESRAALLLGDSAAAAAVLTWLLERADAPGEVVLMRAWGEMSAGHHHAAGDLVRSVLSGSDRLILPHSHVEALLAGAALALAADDPVGARRALQEALTRAEPNDALRPFALAGPAVRALLVGKLGTFGAVESFAVRAVAAHKRVAEPPSRRLLTERELAVLYLLPSLLSLEEIAEDLSISINTVKSHIRSIYAKLSVSSRRAAVVTAHERGLLTTTTSRRGSMSRPSRRLSARLA